MLVIQDINTRRALLATNRYRSLKTTTAIDIGFETMSVQVDATSTYSGNAESNWIGQGVVVNDIDGIVWEGVIDQVQKAEGYWNIFAVGHSIYELAMQPVFGIYYANLLSDWKEIANGGIGTKVEEDTGLHFEIAGGEEVADASRGGLEWNSPFAGDANGRLRWLRVRYQRIGVSVIDTGGYDFRIYGVNGGVESLLLSVAISAVDLTEQTFTWTDATGIEQIRMVLVKTGGTGTSTDPTNTVVRVYEVEASLLEDEPTIDAVMAHLFSRNIESNVTVQGVPSLPVLAPVVADGSQSAGQDTVVNLRKQMEAQTADPWFVGAWGRKLVAYSTERNRWRITSKDVGQGNFYNASRMAPAVGDGNLFTAVTAHYTDSDGVGRFTNWYETGIKLPRQRLEIIEASSELNADAEAEARATALGAGTPEGSFVLTANARLEKGGYRHVTAVRAFDWAVVDSISLGPNKTDKDSTRGGYIGKTTYDGDSNEITVELLGNDNG